jgi:predicted AAA+ superfamily ATPase
MERPLASAIRKDLDEKLVILSGPRQVGKTTLAKSLFPDRQVYLNFDAVQDRVVIQKQTWSRAVELVVFDELHLMRRWKSWIKGIYDTEGVRPRLLVTGSASLESFRRGRESLAGRFFNYRLHPFSLAEVKGEIEPAEALDRILRFGGFPEPFLKANATFADRWRRSHVDRILREDLLNLAQVRDLKALEFLVELLSTRVGIPVKYASLAGDLQVSPHTVKSWLSMLESLYILFLVTPHTRNVANAILKEPKVYFYDTGRVADDPGMRFENAVACALLKRQHFLEDTLGQRRGLHYVRDKQGREVDFLTTAAGAPEWLVEAKVSDETPARPLHHYVTQLKPKGAFQVVRALRRDLDVDRVKVRRADAWLASLEA